MTKLRGNLVQAVPLLEGKINVGAGTYEAEALIHADVDCSITITFPSGDVTIALVAGDDRAYEGVFTVVSGTVTYE